MSAIARLLDRAHDRLVRLRARRLPTLFGTALIYDTRWRGRAARLLFVEESLQSATYLDEGWCDLPFVYLEQYDKVFAGPAVLQRICMLGGGGFAFPKHVIAHHPATAVDVVEVDAAMVDIASRYFLLDRLEQETGAQASGRLCVVVDDARRHLERCAREGVRYDAIVNDCYQAGEADSSLATIDGVRLVHSCLSSAGVYLANVIATFEGEGAFPFEEAVAILSEEFVHVGMLLAGSNSKGVPNNVVVVAADEPLELEGLLPLFDAC